MFIRWVECTYIFKCKAGWDFLWEGPVQTRDGETIVNKWDEEWGKR